MTGSRSLTHRHTPRRASLIFFLTMVTGCGTQYVGPRDITEHTEGWPRLEPFALEKGTPVVLTMRSGETIRGMVLEVGTRKIRIQCMGHFEPVRKVLAFSDIARIDYDQQAPRESARAGVVVGVFMFVVGTFLLTAIGVAYGMGN